MRHFAKIFTVLAGVAGMSAGCANAGAGAAASDDGSAREALAAAGADDVSPECEGIIGYANFATFEMLDAFWPSDLAQRVVTTRSTAPFTTLASLSSVSGMGDFRLQQIEHEARAEEFIDQTCSGIYEELALSAGDATAVVAYVNGVPEVELDGVLSFLINPMARDNLLAGRPFANVGAIAGVAGVGVDTFRALRDAAVSRGPFEALASAVNGLERDVTILRHFDWVDVVTSDTGRLSGMTCFGVDESLLVNGATIRPELADAAEVLAAVTSAVDYADRFDDLTVDPAPGLADLAQRVEGGTFFGCYLRYTPDPWSGINRNFFVDTVTGFGVLTETRWSE